MKRNDIITKLTEIGRNPHRLDRMTNNELRQVMVDEAPKLAEVAQRKAALAQVQEQSRLRNALKAKRRARQMQERLAYETQQRQAELERLRRISKPLPAIPSAPGEQTADTVTVRQMIAKISRRIADFTEQFRLTGDRKYVQMIGSDRENLEYLRASMSEMGGAQ